MIRVVDLSNGHSQSHAALMGKTGQGLPMGGSRSHQASEDSRGCDSPAASVGVVSSIIVIFKKVGEQGCGIRR